MSVISHADQYKDVVLFLATAGVIVPLFTRARVSPVLGFLLAGVVLGPHGLGAGAARLPWLAAFTIGRPDQFDALGELGVVFLLFMIGLELSWERLRLMRRLVFGLGGLQILTSTAAIALVARLLGADAPASLVIGAALALSSTALVVPALAERRRLQSASGRATLAVLLGQDLAVAPILVALTFVAERTPGGPIHLIWTLAPAIIGVGALALLGRLGLRPLLKSVARARSEELFVAACLLVIIGAGLLAALAGLSMALGAFVAGLLLAETEFRHQVEVLIEPFKGLLLGVFFVSLGINFDLPQLIADPAPILDMAAALLALKAVIVFVLARVFGLRSADAGEAAFSLAAAGEFAFVVLNQALAARLIDDRLGAAILLAAVLTMFASPLLIGLGRRLSDRVSGRQHRFSEPPVAENAAQVLVVGYGRVGELVGEMLDRHEIPWLAVERSARRVEQARRTQSNVIFGDANRPELLRRLGLADAKALVVTMDAPDIAEAVTAVARTLRPNLTIVVRARDARHARRLYDLGATDAVPETVEASLQLSEAALVDIGIPMGLVIASIHERREAFRAEFNRPEALGGRRRLLDAG